MGFKCILYFHLFQVQPKYKAHLGVFLEIKASLLFILLLKRKTRFKEKERKEKDVCQFGKKSKDTRALSPQKL